MSLELLEDVEPAALEQAVRASAPAASKAAARTAWVVFFIRGTPLVITVPAHSRAGELRCAR
jgi:hypothetical protein